MSKKTWIVIGLGLSGLCAPTIFAQSAPPAPASIEQELDALKRRIAELENRQQLDRSVNAAKADAQQRDAGPLNTSTNWDNGFVTKSDDGNFQFQPYVEVQFRYLLNSLDGDQNIRDGFDIRRASLGLKGHVFSPALKYNLKWITNRDGGGVSLETGFIQYRLSDRFELRAGQWLSDVFRESEVGSVRQMGVDRSLVSEVMGLGELTTQQGVQLRYGHEAEPLRVNVALTDGANSGNTPFTDVVSNYGAQFRATYKFFGSYKEYADHTALGIKQQLLVAGLSLDYTAADSSFTDTSTTPPTVRQPTLGVYRHSADVVFKDPGGLSVLGVYYGKFTNSSDDQAFDFGLLAQVGYVIPGTNWEPFVQLAYINLESQPTGVAEETFYQATAGATYYYHKQNAKFTFDVTSLPNGSPKSSTSFGGFASDESQLILRTQFQLLF